jgi:hypothetical protein
MFLAILLGSLVVFGSQRSPQDFTSAVEALHALDRMGECKCDTDVKAYRYFVNHPDESIPVLIDFTLKNKQRHYVSVRALAKIRDERVITFLIQLTYDELHSDDSYNPEHPYYSEGLISHLIRELGDYGDKRAIPVIEESLSRLNNQHRDEDWEALCELGKISVSELFERHLKSVEKIHGIASGNVYANPRFSIEVFDWLITHFLQRRKLVNDCHVGKVMALFNVQEYALALCESEFLKQNIDEETNKRLYFNVVHRGYSLDEMIELLKTKVETK